MYIKVKYIQSKYVYIYIMLYNVTIFNSNMYKVYMAKATCNRISLLCDSPILGALNFCPFHWNLKGNYILRKIVKKKNIYMWNQLPSPNIHHI